jgi:hypothetical protein
VLNDTTVGIVEVGAVSDPVGYRCRYENVRKHGNGVRINRNCSTYGMTLRQYSMWGCK